VQVSEPAVAAREQTREQTRELAGRELGEGLSEAVIVDAAMRLARRQGLERFTMRELAEELGVTQMAAYHHIRSKDALVALVADRILEDVRLPGPEAGDWDERLRRLLRGIIPLLETWEGIGALLQRHVPPSSSRMIAEITSMLVEAGLDDGDAAMATAMVRAWSYGEVMATQALRQSGDEAQDIEFRAFAVELLIEGIRSRIHQRASEAAPS
jgi:AcrR family transcriptional regulator